MSTTRHTELDGPDPHEGPDLESVARLRLAIGRLQRQLRTNSSDGLSLSSQSALFMIGVHGPLSLGKLAELERVAPSMVTKLVARLESEELVERKPHLEDRRVTLVAVTPDGLERMDEIRSRRSAWLAGRMAELSSRDLDCLLDAIDVLEKLQEPAETDQS